MIDYVFSIPFCMEWLRISAQIDHLASRALKWALDTGREGLWASRTWWQLLSMHTLLLCPPPPPPNGNPGSAPVLVHLLDVPSLISIVSQLLYMPYISRGFYFREFRESGTKVANLTTRDKYLQSSIFGRMNADLCTQY